MAITDYSSPITGIPDPTEFGDISNIPKGQVLPMVIQRHEARKAGLHRDVRFGKDKMFSWATKKQGLPLPGEMQALFQTPLHEESYMHYSGELPRGMYGAGKVSPQEKGSIIVHSADPDKVVFSTAHTRYPQTYVMLRTGQKPTDWLVKNLTPKSLEEFAGPGVSFAKEHYKTVPSENVSELYSPKNTFSEKIDGARMILKLRQHGIDAASYRPSITGAPIMHTTRLQLPRDLNIPSSLVGSTLLGEAYGQRVEKGAAAVLPVTAERMQYLSGLAGKLHALKLANPMEYDAFKALHATRSRLGPRAQIARGPAATTAYLENLDPQAFIKPAAYIGSHSKLIKKRKALGTAFQEPLGNHTGPTASGMVTGSDAARCGQMGKTGEADLSLEETPAWYNDPTSPEYQAFKGKLGKAQQSAKTFDVKKTWGIKDKLLSPHLERNKHNILGPAQMPDWEGDPWWIKEEWNPFHFPLVTFRGRPGTPAYHSQISYDLMSGKRVLTGANQGTYDVVSPEPTKEWKRPFNAAGHFLFDIMPHWLSDKYVDYQHDPRSPQLLKQYEKALAKQNTKASADLGGGAILMRELMESAPTYVMRHREGDQDDQTRAAEQRLQEGSFHLGAHSALNPGLLSQRVRKPVLPQLPKIQPVKEPAVSTAPTEGVKQATAIGRVMPEVSTHPFVVKDTQPKQRKPMKPDTRSLEQDKAAAVKHTGPAHKNYYNYLKLFQHAIGTKSHKRILLGRTPAGPVYLYQATDMSKPRILVVAGQHGEEPGGPWALLRALHNSKKPIQDLSVSFIPVANPYGFRTGKRPGSDGKPTNWMMDDNNKLRNDGECIKILTKNAKLLKMCGKDATLNVHEDITSKGFYIYVLGDTKAPVVKAMLKVGKQWFEYKKDGEYTDNGTYKLKDGMVDNHKDGTLDHWLYNEGSKIAITMEMPAKEASMFDRIHMGSALIRTFLTYMAGITKKSEAVPVQEFSGVLNSSLAESLRKQKEQGVEPRVALFNILSHGKKPVGPEVPYKQRVEMLKEVMQHLPEEKFHLPEMATTPETQQAMWEKIQAGENPRTREGVVVFSETGVPTKVKIMPEYDAIIQKMFPGQGKYEGSGAGGFEYSLPGSTDVVGKVGTGISDEMRQQMQEHPEEFVGRTARIKAMGQYPSGAFRAPSMISLHEG